MQYFIFDVETAKRDDTSSFCAIDWVLFGDDCAIVNKGYTLINPECEFDAYNINIHHIKARKVADAPTFAEYWESTLKKLFVHNTFIGHNAPFAANAVQKKLDQMNVSFCVENYIDTLPLFRKCFPDLGHYGLADLAKWAHISFRHHVENDDSLALLKVIQFAMKALGLSSFTELLKLYPERKSAIQEKYICLDPYQRYHRKIDDMIENASSQHVNFTDLHFAFTGESNNPEIMKTSLQSIVEQLGGTFHKSVSAKVDYFVRLDDSETETLNKAKALAENPGCQMQIVNREYFFTLLGYNLRQPDLQGPDLIRHEKEAALLNKQKAKEEEQRKKLNKIAEKSLLMDKPKRAVKGVDQFTLDGVFLKSFVSVATAAEETLIDKEKIKDAARGKQRTAGGYCWKYRESEEKQI